MIAYALLCSSIRVVRFHFLCFGIRGSLILPMHRCITTDWTLRRVESIARAIRPKVMKEIELSENLKLEYMVVVWCLVAMRELIKFKDSQQSCFRDQIIKIMFVPKLAYREHGVPKETAEYKIFFVHGFDSCRLA